jgi:hypothetical protein
MVILSWIKKSVLLITTVAFLAWVFIFNWSFVFKKKVVGEVIAVERVAGTLTVITNSQEAFNPQAFSFSVAIKDLQTSEIHMASSEDRQWAAVQKGNCVVSAFFPYPPWNFQKGTTAHNARLLKNYADCKLATQAESVWDNIKFFFLWL